MIFYAIFRTSISHFTQLNLNILNWYNSIEFLFLGIYATVMIFKARDYFDPTTFNYRMISYFSYGFILWALGNFILIIETIIFDQPKVPTPSDIFYIGGYLPIIFILITRSRSTLVSPEKIRFIVVVLLFILFSIISFNYVILPIYNSEERLMVRLFTLVYPILDIILMGSALTLFPKYAGGKLEKVWLLVSICIMVNAISDLIFTYQYWHDSYNAKSWGNDFVIYTYLLIVVLADYLKDLFYNRSKRLS